VWIFNACLRPSTEPPGLGVDSGIPGHENMSLEYGGGWIFRPDAIILKNQNVAILVSA
jgi:hypothetical protein